MLRILVVLVLSISAQASEPQSFRMHLISEPETLDPSQALIGTHHYLYSLLYRSLTRWTAEGRLQFDQAKKCRYLIQTHIQCTLHPDLKWSDGTPLTAQDFANGLLRHLSLKSSGAATHLLMGLKNAKAYLDGKAVAKDVGLTAEGQALNFFLETPDREFLEKLSSVLLVPFKDFDRHKPATLLVNGPYKIKEWLKGQKLILESNKLFKDGHPLRPILEIYFVREDSSALTLYEKGTLNFLWRLPVNYIPKFKSRPDFLQIPLSRFDYVGFNLKPGSPFANIELRKAFAGAIDHEAFKKAFFALGGTGCPSLSENLLEPNSSHCQEFQGKKKIEGLPKKVHFVLSQLGGDDLKKYAEFFQEQWRLNLGANVEVKLLEHKHYLATLKEKTPDSFRRGIPLDRPTCLAGLEKFKKDSSENYIGFSDSEFEVITKALESQKLTRVVREGLCGKASDIIFKKHYAAIPLGRMHFTMLMNPHFKGWEINELNQLDLSQLHYEP